MNFLNYVNNSRNLKACLNEALRELVDDYKNNRIAHPDHTGWICSIPSISEGGASALAFVLQNFIKQHGDVNCYWLAPKAQHPIRCVIVDGIESSDSEWDSTYNTYVYAYTIECNDFSNLMLDKIDVDSTTANATTLSGELYELDERATDEDRTRREEDDDDDNECLAVVSAVDSNNISQVDGAFVPLYSEELKCILLYVCDQVESITSPLANAEAILNQFFSEFNALVDKYGDGKLRKISPDGSLPMGNDFVATALYLTMAIVSRHITENPRAILNTFSLTAFIRSSPEITSIFKLVPADAIGYIIFNVQKAFRQKIDDAYQSTMTDDVQKVFNAFPPKLKKMTKDLNLIEVSNDGNGMLSIKFPGSLDDELQGDAAIARLDQLRVLGTFQPVIDAFLNAFPNASKDNIKLSFNNKI